MPAFLLALAAAVCAASCAAAPDAAAFARPAPEHRPETWFHLIGGNVARAGLDVDLDAVQAAGIGGIQLFHGQLGGPWPGVSPQIPCLSADWDDLIRFVAEGCARRGLGFKMQNCPGWSMSGGPWIPPERAMRNLTFTRVDVPGGATAGALPKPNWQLESRLGEADLDYRDLFVLAFPTPEGDDGRAWTPPPAEATDADGVLRRVYRFDAPRLVRAISLPSPRQMNHDYAYRPEARVRLVAGTGAARTTVLDAEIPQGVWQDTVPLTFACDERVSDVWTLELAHRHPMHVPSVAFHSGARLDNWEGQAGWVLRGLVRRPAPRQSAAGWVRADAVLDLTDRFRDGVLAWTAPTGRTWTETLEADFRAARGYDVRRKLPAVFGWVLDDPAATARVLLDWRRTLGELVERNYYARLDELAHAHGLTAQYETAFGDVLPGDLMRFWKGCDVPMCEFWHPRAEGGVGQDDFKPVLPCASAAHVYGKGRVAAEAFTTCSLKWNEDLKALKRTANHALARGVTHLVFHTYTHNPRTDAPPPGTSFGHTIGTPFVRGQTWWGAMRAFTDYFARCGAMLEAGLPCSDVLWFLGDEVGHKPSEASPLPEGFKYDYCNPDALLTRVAARDGRATLPDGTCYAVLWVPEGTYVAPASEAKLRALAAADGGRTRLALDLACGESVFVVFGKGVAPAADEARADAPAEEVRGWRVAFPKGWGAPEEVALDVLKSWTDLPLGEEGRHFSGTATYRATIRRTAAGAAMLDLGRVESVAAVYVNGRRVRTLWAPPYRCAVALEAGANELRVEVTSTWFNRLVYDAGLPEARRKTWTIGAPKKDAPLEPSGLLGPVFLR